MRICAMLMCLSMLLCFSMISCNKEEEKTEETPELQKEQNVEMVEVVRLSEDIKKGIKVTTSKIEVVKVDKASLPSGTILNKDEVLGKFTVTEMYAGEYFMPIKLTDERPAEDSGSNVEKPEDTTLNFATSGYVIITDYLKPNSGEDVSDAIQSLVDENPQKTLYFPDGQYSIKNTTAVGVAWRTPSALGSTDHRPSTQRQSRSP